MKRLAVRSPTLPPATHTNCYRFGDLVIDPASPEPEEQERLARWAGPVRRVLLTHHHADHIGGVADLVARCGARVHAHPDSRLPFAFHPVEDGEELETDDGRLRAWHSPGHADGHLAFELVGSGDFIVGDLVAGVGTIVLVPPEGHLRSYLASLARLRPHLRRVWPAHGPELPPESFDHYAAHRAMRSEQVYAALLEGAADAVAVAARVYAGLPGVDPALAAVQVGAHLEWLREEGRVVLDAGRFRPERT